MRCSANKQKISDYVDNELNAAESQLLEQHLDGCPECQKLCEDFKKIKADARGLVEFSPSGQTWFKIASGIKEKQNEVLRPTRLKQRRFVLSPSSFGWVVSAGLLLVIIVGAVTIVPKLTPPAANSQQYVVSKLEEAEHYYQKAIDALWEAVSAQEENFDPQLFAVFQKNLTIIDESITACKDAVISRPNNLDSRNYLLAAYQEKRALLENMMSVNVSPLAQRDQGSIY
ncbi:MAG: zf-HC2 domain-containing protein [Candidatus Aminicenantes bacterium]|nr:zf-HC2 domain-containing protein [Candidatus Aminicenantes bacterium]